MQTLPQSRLLTLQREMHISQSESHHTSLESDGDESTIRRSNTSWTNSSHPHGCHRLRITPDPRAPLHIASDSQCADALLKREIVTAFRLAGHSNGCSTDSAPSSEMQRRLLRPVNHRQSNAQDLTAATCLKVMRAYSRNAGGGTQAQPGTHIIQPGQSATPFQSRPTGNNSDFEH
jgi:hypothetical protein